MRIATVILSIGFFVVSHASSRANDGRSEIVIAAKDEQSVQLISHCLENMGVSSQRVGTGYKYTAEASVWGGKKERRIVTFSSKITGESRLDIGGTDDESATIVVINRNGQYFHSQKNQPLKAMPTHSAASQSVYFILPFLSDTLHQSNISLVYKGMESTDNGPREAVEVMTIMKSLVAGQFSHSYGQRTIYFDPSTGMVSQVAYRSYSPGSTNVSVDLRVEFTDYHLEGAFNIPREIIEYRGTQIINDLVVTAFLPNVNLDESLFNGN